MVDAETGEVLLGKKMVHLSKAGYRFSVRVHTAFGVAALARHVIAKNELVATYEKPK